MVGVLKGMYRACIFRVEGQGLGFRVYGFRFSKDFIGVIPMVILAII